MGAFCHSFWIPSLQRKLAQFSNFFFAKHSGFPHSRSGPRMTYRNMKKYFNVSGMHCKACKTLIETEISELEGVKSILVDYKTGQGEIEFNEKKISFDKIKSTLKNINYPISEKETAIEGNKKSLIYWLLAGLALLLVYFLIGQSDSFELLARLNDGSVTLGLVFVIGLLSSFHCIGMCGGIIVSYSAARFKNNDKSLTPHWFYNMGRIISYTAVGFVLGGIGSFFGLNPSFTGSIIILASIFMILLGLSLLTEFKWLKKIKLSTPEFVAKFLYSNKHNKKPKGPFIVGLLTAFMPCGPLQAMQVYALSTGSFVQGGLAMFVYSLGTTPLLLGFGGIISKLSQAKIKNMVKISGIIVIILGIVMLNRGLVNFGFGANAFFSEIDYVSSNKNLDQNKYQEVEMAVTYRGYVPNVIYLKKDIPVRWIIKGEQVSGCTDEIQVPEYGIKQPLQKGKDVVVEFTPTKTGEIKFHCWMKMVWGKFIVTEDENISDQTTKYLSPTSSFESSSQSNGACSGTCGNSSCAAKTSGSCGCGAI